MSPLQTRAPALYQPAAGGPHDSLAAQRCGAAFVWFCAFPVEDFARRMPRCFSWSITTGSELKRHHGGLAQASPLARCWPEFVNPWMYCEGGPRPAKSFTAWPGQQQHLRPTPTRSKHWARGPARSLETHSRIFGVRPRPTICTSPASPGTPSTRSQRAGSTPCACGSWSTASNERPETSP